MNPKFYQIIIFLFFLISGLDCINKTEEQQIFMHDMEFDSLSCSWDEAIPLGNGMLGNLVWQNGENLRFSLDRADLWDLRPMENIGKEEWKYKWVNKQWKNNTYSKVQEMFDAPYDRNPAPSKIPAGAVEFNTSQIG